MRQHVVPVGNHQPGVPALRFLLRSACSKDDQHGVLHCKASFRQWGKIQDESLTTVILIVMQKTHLLLDSFRNSNCCINIVFLVFEVVYQPRGCAVDRTSKDQDWRRRGAGAKVGPWIRDVSVSTKDTTEIS